MENNDQRAFHAETVAEQEAAGISSRDAAAQQEREAQAFAAASMKSNLNDQELNGFELGWRAALDFASAEAQAAKEST